MAKAKLSITTHGEKLWAIRCPKPNITAGGVHVAESKRASMEVPIARVIAVGPNVKRAKVHDIIIFDDMEAVPRTIDTSYGQVEALFITDEAVDDTMSIEQARDLGLAVPNLEGVVRRWFDALNSGHAVGA